MIGASERPVLGRRVWVKATTRQEVTNAGVMPNGMTGSKNKE